MNDGPCNSNRIRNAGKSPERMTSGCTDRSFSSVSHLLLLASFFSPYFHLFRHPAPPRNAGLRYEDLLNEGELDIAEALTLADADVLTGRTRRIKRALDLGFKRKNLQDYAPGMELDIYKSELYETVEKIRAREQEYALLNVHNK